MSRVISHFFQFVAFVSRERLIYFFFCVIITNKVTRLGDLGLDETVLIDGYENTEGNAGDHQEEQASTKETKDTKSNKKSTTNKTAPNTHNHT